MRYPKKLGVLMHNWHSGQGDPIYKVGSMIYAGKDVDKEDVEEAIDGLRRIMNRVRDGDDAMDLEDIIWHLENDGVSWWEVGDD